MSIDEHFDDKAQAFKGLQTVNAQFCPGHKPQHVYQWKDPLVEELHPEGLYIATCRRCGTDYRIPAYAWKIIKEYHPELVRE